MVKLSMVYLTLSSDCENMNHPTAHAPAPWLADLLSDGSSRPELAKFAASRVNRCAEVVWSHYTTYATANT